MKNLVCLVKINERIDMNMPPLGLLYIGDALVKAGYKVKIYHLTNSEADTYADKIIQDDPLFVGFSVFTGNSMKAYVEMCKIIKKKSKIPILWGNAHPTLMSQQCLNEDYIDLICIGEGEETTVELAVALREKGDLSKIKGIGYKENGRIIINERREFIKNLDNYSLNWDLVDINQYIQPRWNLKRVLPITTSRGCPYNCGFCYNQEFNKRKWRAHSIDFVVSHLKKIKDEHRLDGLLFLDDEFFVNKERAFEIVKRIGLPYYANARVEYVNDKFAVRLKDTNCKVIMFGLESGNNRVLKELVNKGSTVEDSINAVKLVSKYKDLEINISFIVAFPDEAFEEFRDTQRLAVNLIKIHPKMTIAVGFYLPVPGTSLFDLAIKKGFKPPIKTEDWQILDKWIGSKFKLVWIDWTTSKKCIQLRRDFLILSLLYKKNIPAIKNIMAWRLSSGNRLLPLDMCLIILFWKLYSRWLTIKIELSTKRKKIKCRRLR